MSWKSLILLVIAALGSIADAAVPTRVLGVLPTEIYVTKESRIQIRVQHAPSEQVEVFLEKLALPNSETLSAPPDQYLVTAVVSKEVAKELGEGTHNLSVRARGLSQTIPLSIKGPIDAKVQRIVPSWVMRYQQGRFVLSIEGNNLTDITGVNFAPLLYPSGAKLLGTESLRHIEESISIQFGRANTYTSNWLEFGDGTRVPLPTFAVYDRVAPWSIGSWISFLLYHGVFAAICTFMFYAMATDSHQLHLKNKTAPGLVSNLMLSLAAIAASVICVLGATLFWSSFNTLFEAVDVSFAFLITTALVSLNLVLPVMFVTITGKFRPIAPPLVRWVIASALMLTGFAAPFLMTSRGLSPWAIRVETGILLVTLVLGGSGGEAARSRLLAERRQGPEDVVIDRIVEELLYSRGSAATEGDLAGIPRDRIKAAFLRFLGRHGVKLALELVDDAETLQLRFSRYAAVAQISAAFKSCREALAPERNSSLQEQLSRVADVVRSNFGFERGQPYTIPQIPDGTYIASTMPSGLESVLPNPFPTIVFASSQQISETQIRGIQQALNIINTKTRFGLTITVNHSTTDRQAIQKNLGGIGRENMVVLGERELITVVGAREPLRVAFMQSVQEQVDLSVFSPYTVEGPTPMDMFYGRKAEIGTILERIAVGSVAVLGARRIGKTSMLQATQRVLVDRGKLLLYLDCYFISNYASFLREAASRWRLSQATRLVPGDFRDLPAWIIALKADFPDQQLVIQLDEIDRLLDYDASDGRDETFFRMLRSLAQENRCQFIFSGERTLLDKLVDPSSSFFNFVTPVYLGLLDREASTRIVTNPMRLVGVTLETDGLAETIYEHTAGHPNLIQYVCRQCLSALGSARIRVLTADTLLAVLNSGEFRDQFLSTFWSQATATEKAVSVCVLEKQRANQREVLDYLAGAGFPSSIRDLNRGIKYLMLSQLLESNADSYFIKPTKFGEALSAFPFPVWLGDFRAEFEAERRQVR